MLADIWGKKADPFFFIYNAMFGIGSFVAPLLMHPFVRVRYVKEYSTDSEYPYYNSSDIYVHNSTGLKNISANGSYLVMYEPLRERTIYEGPIEYPFAITGAMGLLAVLTFLGIFIYERIHPNKIDRNLKCTTGDKDRTAKEIFDPKYCTNGNRTIGSFMMTLIFLFTMSYAGAEHGYRNFIYSYVISMRSLGMGIREATWVNTAFGVAFTVSRFATALAAVLVHPKFLLPLELAGNIIVAVVLGVWGSTVPGVIWAGFILVGVFIGQLWPTGQAWTNRYVLVTPMVMSLIQVGGSLGALIFSYINAYLFERVGSSVLPWVCLASIILTSLLTVMLQCVANTQGEIGDERTKRDCDEADAVELQRLALNTNTVNNNQIMNSSC